jgi:hypothetical protein
MATPADRREGPEPDPADRPGIGVDIGGDAAIGPSTVRIVVMNALPGGRLMPL